MNEVNIRSLCDKLNITPRTLRYYEEIGLVNSKRDGENTSRYYDEQMSKRIEQIVALRRLSLSLKEIKSVLYCKTMDEVIEVFTNRLKNLKDELDDYIHLIHNLEDMIQLLKRNRVYELNDVLLDDVEKDKEETAEIDLRDRNIRIIRLHPMRVAYCVKESKHPEEEAWDNMNKWIRKKKLDQLFSTRYFGFNNPDPSPSNPVYGYEVWATVNDDVEESDGIKIKTFPGGLYAVITSDIVDVIDNWQKLYSYVRENEQYDIGERWLEEHLILDKTSWSDNFQVDLYCPLIKKGENE